MTPNPFADAARVAHLEAKLLKSPQTDPAEVRSHLRAHLRTAESLGHTIRRPARILDVGCGAGDAVEALREQGFDASGVDVLELWGRDFDQFWQTRARPTGTHLSHLHVVSCDNYRLPFPNAHFDFAFSDQVFEHVFNCEDVFREVARVLKPGAISLHEFPGPNTLVENHINVPLPPLCAYRPYLAFWALAGRRSSRQTGFGWRETLELNVETMRLCHYPLKRTLIKYARRAGVRIEFNEVAGIRAREDGRLARLLRRVPAPMRGLCERLGALVSQRTMIIHGRQ